MAGPAAIPSISSAASAGPSRSGDSQNGSTIFTNGGLTVNRNNPWMMTGLIALAVVVVVVLLFKRKKK